MINLDALKKDTFIEALGCSKGSASATSTKMVIQEVPLFFKEEPSLDKRDAKKIGTNYLRKA